MRLVALLIYVPFQVAFVPLAIFGMLLQLYRQVVVSEHGPFMVVADIRT